MKKPYSSMDRRQILKGAGAVALGGAVALCANVVATKEAIDDFHPAQWWVDACSVGLLAFIDSQSINNETVLGFHMEFATYDDWAPLVAVVNDDSPLQKQNRETLKGWIEENRDFCVPVMRWILEQRRNPAREPIRSEMETYQAYLSQEMRNVTYMLGNYIEDQNGIERASVSALTPANHLNLDAAGERCLPVLSVLDLLDGENQGIPL